MSVDPKVYDLACSFLLGVEHVTDADKRKLAEEIQVAVEDFMRARFDLLITWLPEGVGG